MARFARLNGLTSMKLTPTLMALAIGVITANSAHAEKYCKSVDQSGNASYTLAPATGCKNKFKTVGVSQFKPTVVTANTAAVTTTNTEQSKSTTTSSSMPTTPTTNNVPVSQSAAPKTQAPAPVVSNSSQANKNPENQ